MSKTLLALIFTSMLAAAWWLLSLDLNDLIRFAQSGHADFARHYEQSPQAVLCGFFCLFTLIATLAIPGASLLMLIAGANFGLFWGTVLSLLASTTGATLSMLAARHFFQARFEKRFAAKLAAINIRLDQDGAFYLFSLRMAPVIPYAILNPLCGLSRIKTSTFFVISAAGMLAGTAIYVNAGRAMADLDSAGDILSPGTISALALLGLLPLLSRKRLKLLRGQPASNLLG